MGQAAAQRAQAEAQEAAAKATQEATNEMMKNMAAQMAQVASSAQMIAGLMLSQASFMQLAEASSDAKSDIMAFNAAAAASIATTAGLAVANEAASGSQDDLEDQTEDGTKAANRNIFATIGQTLAKINLTAVTFALVGAMLLLVAVYAVAVIGALLFAAALIGMLAYIGGVQAALDGIKAAGMAFYEVILSLVSVGAEIMNWAMSFMGLSNSAGDLSGMLVKVGQALGYLIGLPILGLFAALMAGAALAIRGFRAVAGAVAANTAVIGRVAGLIGSTFVSVFKLVVSVIKLAVAVLKTLAPVFVLVGAVVLAAVAVFGKLVNIITAVINFITPLIGYIGAVAAVVLIMAAAMKIGTVATLAFGKAKALLTTIMTLYNNKAIISTIVTKILTAAQKSQAIAATRASLAMRILSLAMSGGPWGILITLVLALVAVILKATGALGWLSKQFKGLLGLGSENPFKGIEEGANSATEALDKLAKANINASWLSPNQQQQVSYAYMDDTNPYETPARLMEITKVVGQVELVPSLGNSITGTAIRNEDGFNVFRNGEMVYEFTPPSPGGMGNLVVDKNVEKDSQISNVRTRATGTGVDTQYEIYLDQDLKRRIIRNFDVNNWFDEGNADAVRQLDLSKVAPNGWISVDQLNEITGSKFEIRDFSGQPSMAPVQMTASEYKAAYGVDLAARNPEEFAVGKQSNIYMVGDTATVKTNLGYEKLDEKTGQSTGEIVQATSFLGELYKLRQDEDKRAKEAAQAAQVDGGLLSVGGVTDAGFMSRVANSKMTTQILTALGLDTKNLTEAQAATTYVSSSQIAGLRDQYTGTPAEEVVAPILDAAEAEAKRREELEDRKAKLQDERQKALEAGDFSLYGILTREISVLNQEIEESGTTIAAFTESIESATAAQERTAAILTSIVEDLKTELPGFLDYIRISQDQQRLGINTFAQVMANNPGAIDKAIENALPFSYFDSITGEERTREFTQQDFILKGAPSEIPPEFGGNMEAFLRSDHEDAVRFRENLEYQGIDPYAYIENTVGRNPYMVDDRVFQASLGLFGSSATQNQKDLMDRGFFDTPEVVSYLTDQAMLGNQDAGLLDYYMSLGYSVEDATAQLQKHYAELPDDLKDVYGDLVNGEWVMDVSLMDNAVTSGMFTEVADLAFDASGNIVKATSEVLAGIPVAYETALGKTLFMTEEEYAALTDTQKAMIAQTGATVLTYVSEQQEILHETLGSRAAIAYTTAYGQGLETGFADIDGDGIIDKYVVDEAGIRVKVDLDLFVKSFKGLDAVTDELSRTEFIVGSLFEQGLISQGDLAKIQETMKLDDTLGDGVGALDELFATFPAEVQAAFRPLLEGQGEDEYAAFQLDLEKLKSPIVDAHTEGATAAGDIISKAMIDAALVASGRADLIYDPVTGEIIKRPKDSNRYDNPEMDPNYGADSTGGTGATGGTGGIGATVDYEMGWLIDILDQQEEAERRRQAQLAGQYMGWLPSDEPDKEDKSTTEVIFELVVDKVPEWWSTFIDWVKDPDINWGFLPKLGGNVVRWWSSFISWFKDPSIDFAFDLIDAPTWWNDFVSWLGWGDDSASGGANTPTGHLIVEATGLTIGGVEAGITIDPEGNIVITQTPTEKPTGNEATPDPSATANPTVTTYLAPGNIFGRTYESVEAYLGEDTYKYFEQASKSYRGLDDLVKPTFLAQGGENDLLDDNTGKTTKYDWGVFGDLIQDTLEDIDNWTGGNADGIISYDDIMASTDVAGIMAANRELTVQQAQEIATANVDALVASGIITAGQGEALQTGVDNSDEVLRTALTEPLTNALNNNLKLVDEMNAEIKASAKATNDAAKATNDAATETGLSAVTLSTAGNKGISAANAWMVALGNLPSGSLGGNDTGSGTEGGGTVRQQVASGGIVKSPFQLVGELGRELVSLPVGSRVFSASQTENILGEAFKPSVNMMAASVEMPSSLQVESDPRSAQSGGGDTIVVNFNGDMNIRDQRDIELLVDEIDRELGRRTQNAKRGMMGTTRSLSVD
jgi:hypothetical protein